MFHLLTYLVTYLFTYVSCDSVRLEWPTQ